MLSARRVTLAGAAAALVTVLAAGPALAAGTVTITPADGPAAGVDWYFSNIHYGEDGAPTPMAGTGGVAEVPAGGTWGDYGYALEITDGQKARLETSLLNGLPLTDLDGVTYSTYQTGQEGYGPSINVTIDPEGDDDYVTLVWEANKAGFTMVNGVWQDWNTTAGAGWWTPTIPFNAETPGSNRMPTDLATLAEIFGPGSTIIGFAVNVGRHEAMQAFVDGIGITVDGRTTVYDVEPRVLTKDDCKNGGWAGNFEPGQFANQGQCVSSFASQGNGRK